MEVKFKARNKKRACLTSQLVLQLLIFSISSLVRVSFFTPELPDQRAEEEADVAVVPAVKVLPNGVTVLVETKLLASSFCWCSCRVVTTGWGLTDGKTAFGDKYFPFGFLSKSMFGIAM